MELKIKNQTLPEAVDFNYEELKQAITAKTEHYKTIVYTSEQIPTAKKEVANLRALKKALNDERIRLEREYMQPFNDFKAKVNELIRIIDSPVTMIDGQIKGFEASQKEEKRVNLESFFIGYNSFEWLKFEQLFDEKWLNASFRTEKVVEEIRTRVECIKKDLETLANLPEFSFEATEIYKDTLDINKAIQEGKRLSDMAKRKADAEAGQNEGKAQKSAEAGQTATAKDWVSFAVYIDGNDAQALKQFFKDRNIEYKAI